jgi:hypothetical protein
MSIHKEIKIVHTQENQNCPTMLHVGNEINYITNFPTPVEQTISNIISHLIHVHGIGLKFFTPSVTPPHPCLLKERLIILIVVTPIEFLVLQMTSTNKIVQGHACDDNFGLLAYRITWYFKRILHLFFKTPKERSMTLRSLE